MSPRLTAELAVLLWALLATGFWYQGVRDDADYRALVKREAAAQAAQIRAQQLEWDAQLKEARDDRAKALAANDALTTRVDSADRRLHDALTRIGTLSQADCHAAVDATATLATIFGECEEEYRKVVRAADGHVADIQALTAAWPK